MGYRHYFYLVDREEADKIRNFSYKEIVNYAKEHYPQSIEEDELGEGEVNVYFDFPSFLSQELLYEFGKLYHSYDTVSRICSKGEPLFKDKETKKLFEEYVPFIMGREGMREAILCYRDKMRYCSVVTKNACEAVEVYLYKNLPKRKLFNWKYKRIRRLQDNIFNNSEVEELANITLNLLDLWKTIDWDKKALLFYGY